MPILSPLGPKLYAHVVQQCEDLHKRCIASCQAAIATASSSPAALSLHTAALEKDLGFLLYCAVAERDRDARAAAQTSPVVACLLATLTDVFLMSEKSAALSACIAGLPVAEVVSQICLTSESLDRCFFIERTESPSGPTMAAVLVAGGSDIMGRSPSMACALNVLAVFAALHDKRPVVHLMECGAFEFACNVVDQFYSQIVSSSQDDELQRRIVAQHGEVLKHACRLLGNCSFGSTGRQALNQGGSAGPESCKDALVALRGSCSDGEEPLTVIQQISTILSFGRVRNDFVLSRWLLHVLNECAYGGAPSTRQYYVLRCGLQVVATLFTERGSALITAWRGGETLQSTHWTERGLQTTFSLLRVGSDTLHNLIFRRFFDEEDREAVAEFAPLLREAVVPMVQELLQCARTSEGGEAQEEEQRCCRDQDSPLVLALVKSLKMLVRGLNSFLNGPRERLDEKRRKP